MSKTTETKCRTANDLIICPTREYMLVRVAGEWYQADGVTQEKMLSYAYQFLKIARELEGDYRPIKQSSRVDSVPGHPRNSL